jgi:hypothetical protein
MRGALFHVKQGTPPPHVGHSESLKPVWEAVNPSRS